MTKAIIYYHIDKKNIFDTISIKNKLDDISIGAAPWLHKLESQTHIVPFMSPMSSLMQPVSMGIALQPLTIRVAPATSKTKVLRCYAFPTNSAIIYCNRYDNIKNQCRIPSLEYIHCLLTSPWRGVHILWAASPSETKEFSSLQYSSNGYAHW